MTYDFETIIDRRNCGSMKWDEHSDASVEYVPLSVADMEFVSPPPIAKAIAGTADNNVLGYSGPTDEYYEAVISWQKRKHNFDIKKEWIFTTPGVVAALGTLVDAETKPGDSIIIFTPVYYPFDLSIIAKGRKIVYSRLINNGGRYEIDFADFEEKAKQKNVTALMFCNPHNPVGRVWSEDELKRVVDICIENSLFIIDDEIHNDIIMPGYKHTVMAAVDERILDHIAVCTAPSKTFNIAGIQCSNIIIPGESARAKAVACSLINTMSMSLNIFAYPACIAAYTECDEWLSQMLQVVKTNADCVESFMSENYNDIKVSTLEGTYLLWVDFSATGFSYTEIKEMLLKQHIYLDNGEQFGKAGRGYERINLACPTETIKKMLERFKVGMDELYASGVPYHETLTEGTTLENFVYDSAYGTQLTLEKKKTLIIFSRSLGDPVTKAMLAVSDAAYPLVSKEGCEMKFIVQSEISEAASEQPKHRFELIADPDSRLYDQYNVFEEDGIVGLIGGDRLTGLMTDSVIKRAVHRGLFDNLVSGFFGNGSEENKKRALQLPAFVCTDSNMTVTYSHYCDTLSDLPSVKALMKGILK